MTTSDFLHQNLNAELIAVQSDVSSRKKLFEKMAQLLTSALNQNAEEPTKEKEIYHQLWEREKLGNTGIGNGVAIPHSRCVQANQAIIAIMSLQNPIDYDSPDRQPVDIAFGLLVPEDATQDHLNLLADIARMMSNSENKTALSKANSAQEIIDLIGQWSH